MSFIYKVIDHVQLAAPENSEETAREFYSGILGFTEIDKPASLKKNGGVWFQAGGIQVHIGIEYPFVPARKAHPAFRVGNMADLKTYLGEKGAEYREDDRLPGAKRFYMTDPFGNRLEFLEWEK
ncbi:VOC family protein [Lentibacillus salicampi]|uniref:Glyoxalase n=1 Tax=Lentibacillus salicampi TaxID=175306 RepID=A0A4Y9ABF4_9BACI|nr:VOC family protein [Lentibacillus salicampi]TFJ93248.1 glyoxalase [Lentibacillus salicampi]